jgi:hypothetical protein
MRFEMIFLQIFYTLRGGILEKVADELVKKSAKKRSNIAK